jgi:transposase
MAEGRKRRQRRRFTDEFKAEVVKKVLSSGKTAGQIARDLDLTETAVRS